MFMHGEAAIFCGDAVMCRMLAALCGSASSGIVIADGDDAGMQADAFRYCRENALPLILFSIVPAELSLPADISGRILSRPFLFADFTAAVEQLSGTVSVSDQQEKTEGKSAYVYFKLNEPNFELEDGDTGRIELVLNVRENVLTLSEKAVASIGEQMIVYYQKDDGTKGYKNVETGMTINKRIEITGGLQEGETVVVD